MHSKPKTDNFRNKKFNYALQLAETASLEKEQRDPIPEDQDLNTSPTLVAEAGTILLQESNELSNSFNSSGTI